MFLCRTNDEFKIANRIFKDSSATLFEKARPLKSLQNIFFPELIEIEFNFNSECVCLGLKIRNYANQIYRLWKCFFF